MDVIIPFCCFRTQLLSYKVLMLGFERSGKTSLLEMMKNGKMSLIHPTKEPCMHNFKRFILKIWRKLKLTTIIY